MSEPRAHQSTERFEDSASRVNRLFIEGLHDANLAHALALHGSSAISAEDSRSLVRGLFEIRSSGLDGRENSIRALEATLERKLGPVAPWLKADRSELEWVGVAFLLGIRKRVLELARLHLGFAETLVTLAEFHRGTMVPVSGFQTGGSVSTLGHCLLTYVYPAFRDLERLQHCYRGFNSSPCGAGQAAMGARLPIDRERLRVLLAFDDLRPHAGEALWQADGPIELMAAIVALLVNLNRMTDDLRAWASAADAIDMAWVRSLTSSLLAKVPELASLGKEFGENPECFFSIAVELGTAFDGAGRTISLLTSLVNRCVQNVAALQLPRLSSITQTDLVEIFVTRGGVDQTTAQTMAREVERLVAKGEIDFESLTPEAMNVIGIQLAGRPINLTQTDIASAIDPAQRIAARRGPGGAAPERVVEMLTECRARLVRENLWVSIAGQRIAKSEALLVDQAREVAGL